MSERRPILQLIACEANPAGELETFIKNCQRLGWDVHIITTTESTRRLNRNSLAEITGHPIHDDKHTDPLHPLPPAGALAVAPASFDLINKWAYGSNDSLALQLLNEATGLNLPIVAVPTPDTALARHPAFIESVARLRSWGVTVIFDPTLYPPPGPDAAEPVTDPFPWQVAERVVAEWIRFARLPAPGTRV